MGGIQKRFTKRVNSKVKEESFLFKKEGNFRFVLKVGE